jgi:hypothetical protein
MRPPVWAGADKILDVDIPDLTAVELPPTPVAGSLYKPFRDHEGFTEEWWNGGVWDDGPGETVFVSVRGSGAEVARAELALGKVPPNTYPGWTGPGPFAAIEFFEVAEDSRANGIGRRAVTAIAALFPRYRLRAMSEGADGFWASLGWDVLQHQSDARYRRLYVSPAEWDGPAAG